MNHKIGVVMVLLTLWSYWKLVEYNVGMKLIFCTCTGITL